MISSDSRTDQTDFLTARMDQRPYLDCTFNQDCIPGIAELPDVCMAAVITDGAS
jgi:hypothetical protein